VSGARSPVTATAVVLAYGDEPLLAACVASVTASRDVDVDVVVVDNGCTSDAVDLVRSRPGVRVLTPGSNTGFTGGCNLGVRHATGEVVVLVNSDVTVDPSALGVLAAALDDPTVGIATASLRLMDQPDTMNSAGNPVHFLGLSWAGGLGEPAAMHDQPRPVASASGAVLAVRRSTWQALGGFYEPLFAYCEDLDLSLRCWQRDLSVQFVPGAVAHHAYAFHRNPLKMYLLERNRLVVLLTVYEARTLGLLVLPLLALEAAVLVVAVRQGWWRQKVGGWWWLLSHGPTVRRRRAEVQRDRLRTDAVLAPVLTACFSPGPTTGFSAPRVLTLLSQGWWAVARRRIGQPADRSRLGSLP
jgi:GT2 family glycosyltransferase